MLPDEKSIHQAIFRSLRSALCLSDDDADIHLIRAYADQPAPEPAPSMNLCYYFLQTDPGARLLRETETVKSVPHVYSFLPCRLVLVFYGTDCESWAHRCSSFLFLDGAEKPRGILRSLGLFLIPNPPPPSIVYEEVGKKYRKRADLVIEARLLDDSAYGSIIGHESEPVGTIETFPDVRVHVSE